MANITKITGIDELVKKLEIKRRRSMKEDDGTVVTGFQTKYALIVHENPNAAHGAAYNKKHASKFGKRNKKGQFLKATGGGGKKRGENQQFKYLEKPARELHNNGELRRIVLKSYENGATLSQALVIGALRIQREAQKIVPRDTGNLAGSAFTERDL
jgi:hypothetical protein